jgi:hypothetical protein
MGQANQKSGGFTAVHPRAAGIDVGNQSHWVAVPDDGTGPVVRKFGTFTADLHALADWLLERGVSTVALESTGVYWIPVFEVLESRGLAVCLVDTRRLKSGGLVFSSSRSPVTRFDALNRARSTQSTTWSLAEPDWGPRHRRGCLGTSTVSCLCDGM